MTQACLVSFIRQYVDFHNLYKFPKMDISPYNVLMFWFWSEYYMKKGLLSPMYRKWQVILERVRHFSLKNYIEEKLWFSHLNLLDGDMKPEWKGQPWRDFKSNFKSITCTPKIISKC